jgi:predicted peptidase
MNPVHKITQVLIFFIITSYTLLAVGKYKNTQSLASNKQQIYNQQKSSKPHKDYTLYKGKIVSMYKTQKSISTNYEYYSYKTSSPVALVVIFTGVGGTSFIERKIAKFFVHKKISAVIIEFKKFSNIKTITNFSERVKESILSAKIVLNYFSNLAEIDTTKIATIGISLGGFRAMYLAGIEPKIKATTLVVTGESLSESISRSKLALARRLRRLHMGSIQTNYIDEYVKELKKSLNLQNLTYRKKEHYFLFMAEKDQIVPYDQQQKLWEKLSKPKHSIITGGHFLGILYYSFRGLTKTLNFFKKRWEQTNAKYN